MIYGNTSAALRRPKLLRMVLDEWNPGAETPFLLVQHQLSSENRPFAKTGSGHASEWLSEIVFLSSGWKDFHFGYGTVGGICKNYQSAGGRSPCFGAAGERLSHLSPAFLRFHPEPVLANRRVSHG